MAAGVGSGSLLSPQPLRGILGEAGERLPPTPAIWWLKLGTARERAGSFRPLLFIRLCGFPNSAIRIMFSALRALSRMVVSELSPSRK